MSVSVTAPVWLWKPDKGTWHFLSIGPEQAVEIRLLSHGSRSAFGSAKVQARIGDTCWRTSLFPDSEADGYVLPIKADVRRAEGIAAGDVVTVEIDVL